MEISVTDAAILAGIGYFLVFVGIIALMLVLILVGKSFAAKKAKAAVAQAPAPAPVEVPAPEAPGTAGQLKIYDTDPKTAAMLMAIVADKLGKPLNELRFISIKEVK